MGLAVVFFGYLQCGTVCPSQLMNLAALQERMAGNAVQFVFVSIDPERDSAQHLGSALRRFGPAFAAVRPESAAAARALARQYHDFATPAPGDRSSDINHAGHLHVVTASGRRELVYTSPNLDLDRVAQDLYRLLAQQALPSEAAH